MSEFKKYLISRISDIQLFEQAPYFWKVNYHNTSVMTFPEFQEVYDVLPEPMSRQMVIDIFKEKDLFTSFVAAMVWGGINASRPQRGHAGDYCTTNFYRALAMGRKYIEDTLSKVEKEMAANIDKAANCVFSEDTRINGIGSSFYTKILYFLSYRLETNGVRPLIYDKWGKYMHAALLIENNFEPFSTYYSSSLGERGGFTLRYVNYVKLMHEMSMELDLDNAGRLEAFLFGKELRTRANRSDCNPRFFLKNYVDHNIR